MNIETHEYSFEVAAPAELNVKNIRGRVSVKPGQDGEIKIVETRYLNDGNADQTEVRVDQEPGGKVITEVRMQEPYFGFIARRPMRVDFEIEAPAETNLNVKMVSGPVEVSGLKGQIAVKTVSGPLRVQDLNGEMDLTSVSGSIKGTNLTGQARVDIVSGSLDLRGCDFSSLRANNVSGKVMVGTKLGAGPYELRAVSGPLTLVVPQGSGCQVNANAVSGRFVTDLEISQSTVHRNRWQVTTGDGNVPVRMNTVSGKMRLLSDFDAVGQLPANVQMSGKKRENILERLSEGEIDVAQAVRELGG
jgi:hypothetical protein